MSADAQADDLDADFPTREAGLRVSLAISTKLAGMALGGWLAGAIYDWTGSYAAALTRS